MRPKYIVIIVGLMALAAIGMGGKIETQRAGGRHSYSDCKQATNILANGITRQSGQRYDSAAIESAIQKCMEMP